MKTILLAIDNSSLDANTIDFACYIARLSKSRLTGVFLENLEYEEIYVSKMGRSRGYIDTMISTALPENEEKRAACDENIHRFKEACIARDVEYTIHRDRGVPLKELILESRFADMMIVDAETTFSKQLEEVPTKLVRDILAEAECPVIVAPKHFSAIGEIVFAYDGSRSAMFAIKQFTYLFPELVNTRILVVEVSTEKKIDEKYKIKEWLKSHYSDIELYMLSGDVGTSLMEYMLGKEDAFIVIGAYGRTLISNYLHSSTAADILRFVSKPVFIAHQ